MRRSFIANQLPLCGVGFWAWAEALVLLEREREHTERGVSLVIMAGVIEDEAIEWEL